MQVQHQRQEDLPLAVRRPRRSNFGIRPKEEPVESQQLPPPPPPPSQSKSKSQSQIRTPKRGSKKKVRFSDPGATGLTPFIRRTTLTTTPSRRRASTPSRLGSSTAVSASGSSSTAAAAAATTAIPTPDSLRRVRDGRVERRQRREALRTALDKLNSAHERDSAASRARIERLKDEVKARDREIYELQNATIVIDTDRIWDLEQQVMDLQRDLDLARQKQQQQQKKSSSQRRLEEETRMDWTTLSRDPYVNPAGYEEDEDTAMVFGDSTMAQLECGTPSRARSSFPTPPSTSPILTTMTPPVGQMAAVPLSPGITPHAHLPPINAGVQTSFTDWGREEEVESLQLEIRKLNNTLDAYKAFTGRLSRNLPRAFTDDAETNCNSSGIIERLDGQIDALLRNLSDRTVALETLTAGISSLGFPGDDASAMLQSVTSSLRAARLELEYLTPGELTLPLTSRGAEVLDLLLDRLRDLAKRVKEGDDAVDEYHAIELNLRQQLDARVTVMDELKAEVAKAEGLVSEKTARIDELEIGQERLKKAIDGYVRDVSELERLVERMDEECKSKDTSAEAQAAAVADLEARLAAATRKASDLADELDVAQASRKKQLAAVNRRSGDALALRDARVAELRGEVDRVNGALRSAHETIHALRVDKGKGEEESRGLKAVVDSMKGELQRVLRMSDEFIGAEGLEGQEDSQGTKKRRRVQASSSLSGASNPGSQSAGRAKASGHRKKPRPDNGLALMGEDEVDI
ncbi:hypothetical protein N3K66_003724 [Trichothecium roseum]|uniref:Uncharacterized protein n=1 Tax=Trichothecium roseum TaxID=47278 RepID=A0ACC0V807_9HYPO|nr:hypothetical protein N3K66_003724 [Trichothecium roseum]